VLCSLSKKASQCGDAYQLLRDGWLTSTLAGFVQAAGLGHIGGAVVHNAGGKGSRK
jgi:UDP-N-acetylenolpyruvoylglucosamine reductase